MPRKFLGAQYIGEGRFVIVVQSHICRNFGSAGQDDFRATNNMRIASCSSPDPCGDHIYVRGDDQHENYRIMYDSEYNIKRYFFAFKEYNEYFA